MAHWISMVNIEGERIDGVSASRFVAGPSTLYLALGFLGRYTKYGEREG